MIVVSPPKNLEPNDKGCFPSRSYTPSELSVLNLEKVFMTHDGLCMKGPWLIGKGLHRYPQTRLPFYLRALRTFLSAKCFGRARRIPLDSETRYLTIHHPWINYYHWLLEYLPRLLLVKARLPEFTLLLPESYKDIEFVTESLQAFPLKGIEYIPSGCHADIPHLTLPELRPWGREFDPESLNELRHFLMSLIPEKSETQSHNGYRLYVTRRSATKRRVANESEIEEVLRTFGFEIVDFSKLPFREQMSLCANTQLLVSQHGAGLSNLLFLPEGASVLELHKTPTHAKDFINDLYWHLASARNLSYFYLICPPVDPEVFFVDADIRIPIQKFAELLKSIVEASSP